MGYVINVQEDSINTEYRYTVYQILFPNGKKYIGCTSTNILKRFNDHISAMESGLNYKLYNAMRKYGINNLKIEILGKYKTKEEMFIAEKEYINFFNTKLNGYNSTNGGEGSPGRIHTEKAKQNMSIGQMNRFSKQEERTATSSSVKKWIKQNPAKVKKAVENKLKVIQSDEYKNKMSIKMKELYKNNPAFSLNKSTRIIKKYEDDPFIKIEISKSLGGKPIFVYKDNKFINCFDTISDCCKKLNLSKGNIGMVLNGTRNHTHGYTFKKGEWDD